MVVSQATAYLFADNGVTLPKRGIHSFEQTRIYQLSKPYQGERLLILHSHLTDRGTISTAITTFSAADGPYLATFNNCGFERTLNKLGYTVAYPTPQHTATHLRANGQQDKGEYRQVWDLYDLDTPLQGYRSILVARRTHRSGASITRLFPYFEDMQDADNHNRPLIGSIIGDNTRYGALYSLGYSVDGHQAPSTADDAPTLTHLGIAEESQPSASDTRSGQNTVSWISLLLPALRERGESMRSVVAATVEPHELVTPFDPGRVSDDVTVWTAQYVYFSMVAADDGLAFESVSRNPTKESARY